MDFSLHGFPYISYVPMCFLSSCLLNGLNYYLFLTLVKLCNYTILPAPPPHLTAHLLAPTLSVIIFQNRRKEKINRKIRWWKEQNEQLNNTNWGSIFLVGGRGVYIFYKWEFTNFVSVEWCLQQSFKEKKICLCFSPFMCFHVKSLCSMCSFNYVMFFYLFHRFMRNKDWSESFNPLHYIIQH